MTLVIRLLALACLTSVGTSPAQARLQLPIPVANNAVAGLEVDGTPHLFSFSGLGAGKTRTDITSAAFSIDLSTGAVTKLADVPAGKARLASIAVGLFDRIFIFGGYSVGEDGGEVSTPEVYAFNPVDGSYQRRADMPTPVDDTVAFAYANRYIYLVSGWHNDDNVSDVQVLDTWEDRWFAATEYPGTPVFGHAGGIVGDTIIVADGVGVVQNAGGRRGFAIVNDAYKGTINPEDPADITWEAVLPHPGAPLYRMAATGSESQGLVVFAGGSDHPYNYNGIGYNREPSEPSARVFAFDPTTDSWVEFADKPLATMDHRGLLEVDGVFYTVGGMVGGRTVTNRISSFTLEVARQ
jgi:N-acetylneuraminic acid mutarotase